MVFLRDDFLFGIVWSFGPLKAGGRTRTEFDDELFSGINSETLKDGIFPVELITVVHDGLSEDPLPTGRTQDQYGPQDQNAF